MAFGEDEGEGHGSEDEADPIAIERAKNDLWSEQKKGQGKVHRASSPPEIAQQCQEAGRADEIQEDAPGPGHRLEREPGERGERPEKEGRIADADDRLVFEDGQMLAG